MAQPNFQFCYAVLDFFCKLQIGYRSDIRMHVFVDVIFLYPAGLEVEVLE